MILYEYYTISKHHDCNQNPVSAKNRIRSSLCSFMNMLGGRSSGLQLPNQHPQRFSSVSGRWLSQPRALLSVSAIEAPNGRQVGSTSTRDSYGTRGEDAIA